jgi:hypothetical protein
MSEPVTERSKTKRSTTIDSIVGALLLTRKDAAKVLGLKEGTLRTWATLGRGPRFKKLHDGPRAGVRYPIEEVQAYAQDPAAYERKRSGL